MKLARLAKVLAAGVNTKRRAKGLLPRPVINFLNLHWACFLIFLHCSNFLQAEHVFLNGYVCMLVHLN